MSKSLHEAEVRYLPLEKAILAVVLGTRKLPHYFQAHTVVVLTQLPLETILRSVDYIGRIAKWGTILGAFDIKYMPRTSVKGQVLADLVAEFTEPEVDELLADKNKDEKLVDTISQYYTLTWEVHVDGASNQKGSGVGLVLTSLEKVIVEKSLRLDFPATNKEAEYEALLEGMAMVQRMGKKSIKLFSDSRMKGCWGILAKLKLCSRNLNPLAYYMSLEVAMHMRTLCHACNLLGTKLASSNPC